MKRLTPPINRYLSGKLPSHSSTKNLFNNFSGLSQESLFIMLEKYKLIDSHNKPTRLALDKGFVDECERKGLWNLDMVSKFLEKIGFPSERKYVNQEVIFKEGEPKWVNLGTLATYFNVTASTIGKWLDELDYREKDGMASKHILDQGLANVVEMSAGGKKTRKITQWNLYPIQQILVDNGHPLDFDYEKSLIGKGKNSDVKVEVLNNKIDDLSKEFLELYTNPDKRHECTQWVRKQPTGLLRKIEEKLGKPGFITKGIYLKQKR